MARVKWLMGALLILAALCLGMMGILMKYHSDRQESFYPSLAEADKDGAITRGWVPADLLPASSRRLRITGSLSPSREWCAFESALADAPNFRKTLRSIDALPKSVRRVPHAGTSWWPSVLEGNLEVNRIHTAGLDLDVIERPATSVSNEIFLFAIDWSEGRGYFYSTSD